MQANSIGNRKYSRYALALGLVALGAGFAGQAAAGCAPPYPTAPGGVRPTSALLQSAVYRPGMEPFLRVVDDRDHDRDPGGAAIVGTWRFTFISDGNGYPGPGFPNPGLPPYGATIDFGTQQWHSDGTEFMISGARAPSSGDVCMGSWEQIGNATYKLKHIALAYTSADSRPPGPVGYLGPAIIRETVIVNRKGNTMEGSFTLDQYLADEVALVVHLSGKVTGTRFGVD